MNLPTAIGIVLVCALLLSGCVQTAAPARDTVKVGVLASLSGDAASVLKDSVDTLRAAVQEFNVRPNAGTKIELLFEDSRCNAKEGLTAAQKLLNVDRVAVLLSDDCSGPTLAALPLADQAKTVLLASGATSPNLSGKSPYFFRVIPHDEVQGRQLAEKVADMGFARVAVLFVSNEYGTAFKDVLQKHLDGKAVAIEAVADAETDFRTALTKIKATGPDAVVVVALTPQAPLILRQARELGLLEARFFGSEALKDRAVPEGAGEAAEGLIVSYPAQPGGPAADAFQAFHAREVGGEPGFIAAEAFDAVSLVMKAVESGAARPEDFKAFFSQADFVGASGRIRFDEKGEVTKGYEFYEVRQGKFVKLSR